MATIEVILTEDIHRLGNAGDVVKVKAGFGRNYLLPQGKAMLATASRVKEVEHKRRVIDEIQKKAIAGFQQIARQVAAMDLAFPMQASPEGKLFGSVTNADIAARFAAAGIEVERRRIVDRGADQDRSATTRSPCGSTARCRPRWWSRWSRAARRRPSEAAEPEGLETEERRVESD